MGQSQTQLALRGKEQDARYTQLQEYMVRKAVAEHDSEGLRHLVRYVDVNSFLASGETLLVFAIKEGWVDAVRVLLDSGRIQEKLISQDLSPSTLLFSLITHK